MNTPHIVAKCLFCGHICTPFMARSHIGPNGEGQIEEVLSDCCRVEVEEVEVDEDLNEIPQS